MTSDQENKTPKITVTQSNKNFQDIIVDLGLENSEEFINLDVVITPQHGYMEDEDTLCFPGDTDELFNFLKNKEGDNFHVDIYSLDKYNELVLHADWIRIADILVRDVAAPLLIGLLIEYIKSRAKKKKDAMVDSKVTVVFDNERSATIEYKGSSQEFGEILIAQIQSLEKVSTKALKHGRSPKKSKR